MQRERESLSTLTRAITSSDTIHMHNVLHMYVYCTIHIDHIFVLNFFQDLTNVPFPHKNFRKYIARNVIFHFSLWNLLGLTLGCLRLGNFYKLAEIANIDRAQIGQTQKR